MPKNREVISLSAVVSGAVQHNCLYFSVSMSIFKASHSPKGKTISPRRILFFNKAYDYGFFSSSASRESALIYSNGMSLFSLIGHFNHIFKVSLGDRGEEGTQEEKGLI